MAFNSPGFAHLLTIDDFLEQQLPVVSQVLAYTAPGLDNHAHTVQ
jgi:hypothetical protein